VYVTTLAGVVFINLLWGIGLGFTLAMLLLLRRVARAHVSVDPDGDGVRVRVSGNLSFLVVPSLVGSLQAVPPGKSVELELAVEGIDHAAVEAIRAWAASYENAGGNAKKQALDVLWRQLSGRSA
jgi:carbonic anhydrase